MADAVDFHTDLDDKLQYACRLARKAWRSGHAVLLLGQARTLGRLDVLLWTFDEQEFLPHLRLAAGRNDPAMLRRTPVWLAESADGIADLPPHGHAAAAVHAGSGRPGGRVLINLDADVPDANWPTRVSAHARVIELVGADAADAERGRRLWRACVAARCTARHHRRGDPSGS